MKKVLIFLLCGGLWKIAFSQTITKIEYFIDTDPGYGNATNVSFSGGSTVSTSFNVPISSSLTDGVHKLYVRAKDANDKWSIVGLMLFVKESVPTEILSNLTAAEYFIDTDPGYGLGTSIPSMMTGNPLRLAFSIPANTLSAGSHKVYIRVKDAKNRWSVVAVENFHVQNDIITLNTLPPVWCRNTTFNLPYTASGAFGSGNVFTAQLLDNTGTFVTNIGSRAAITSGNISAVIPNSVALGAGYKIRVVSSSPAISSSSPLSTDVVSVCPSPCGNTLAYYRSADNISSGTVVQQTNSISGKIEASNIIIGATTKVTYQAGANIILQPGFIAKDGAVFSAQIGGCN